MRQYVWVGSDLVEVEIDTTNLALEAATRAVQTKRGRSRSVYGTVKATKIRVPARLID